MILTIKQPDGSFADPLLGSITTSASGNIYTTRHILGLPDDTDLDITSPHYALPNTIAPTAIALAADSRGWTLSSPLTQRYIKGCKDGKYLTILDLRPLYDPMVIHDKQGLLPSLIQDTLPISTLKLWVPERLLDDNKSVIADIALMKQWTISGLILPSPCHPRLWNLPTPPADNPDILYKPMRDLMAFPCLRHRLTQQNLVATWPFPNSRACRTT